MASSKKGQFKIDGHVTSSVVRELPFRNTSLSKIPMKILFILPYQVVPPNSGNKNLSANLLKFISQEVSCDLVMLLDAGASAASAVQLVRHTYPHLQHVAAFHKPQGWTRTIERLKAIYCGYHPSLGSHMSGPLRNWLQQNSRRYHLVHFDMIHTSLYRGSCGDIPSLLVASDAYSMAAWEAAKLLRHWRYRARTRLESLLLSQVERRQYRQFDVVCSVSARDANYLASQQRGLTVKTIGIGLGDEYSKREIRHFAHASTEKVEILITGSLDHEGVALGAAQFIRNCLPALKQKHPGLRVTLLGKNPLDFLLELVAANPELRHLDFVQDYADFLDQDWVYVYPQQNATGLQTKVQQAMALGLPVVAYPVSLGGLNVSSGEHCYICEDAAEITRRVSDLLSNPLQRVAMGKAASAHIRALFSIERTGAEMMSLYLMAIEGFQKRSTSAETTMNRLS